MHLLLVAVALWTEQHYVFYGFFPSILAKNILFNLLDSVITEHHNNWNRLKYTQNSLRNETVDSAWPPAPHVPVDNTKSRMPWPAQHRSHYSTREPVGTEP